MVPHRTTPVDPRRRRRRAIALVATALLGAGLASLGGAPAQAAATTPVMARSQVSAAQLAAWFRSTGKTSKATVPIEALAEAFVSEGRDEGVAGDLAFAQSIVETGYFTFSTRVPPSSNNFSGLGAVDGGTGAASFPDARTGVRAQIQHLRAYADPTVTEAKLAHPLVDGRFKYVSPKGKAPTWEQFGNGTWASDPNYATVVLGVYQRIRAHAGVADRWGPFGSAEALVARSYPDLLLRDATDAERRAGVDALEAGTTPAEHLAGLVAGEGRDHAEPVARLYLSALGRLPDRQGLVYWTTRHRAGVPLVRLADQVIDSSEFAARYGAPGNAGFVDLVYRNVLGRPADADGADYWGRRLAAGQITRAGLVVQFSESSENLRATASATEAAVVYLGMLGRAPDPSILSWWGGKRAGGAPLSTLTQLVFESSEYAARVA